VDLDLGTLRGLGRAPDLVALEVADDHVLRPHLGEHVDLVAAALHDEGVGLRRHAHAGVAQGGRYTGGEAEIGQHAVRQRDLVLDVFQVHGGLRE
jgi:hypothetical protein